MEEYGRDRSPDSPKGHAVSWMVAILDFMPFF